jgi:hypothetical protein
VKPFDRATAVPGGHLAVDQGYAGSVDDGHDLREVAFSEVVRLAAQEDTVDLSGERLQVYLWVGLRRNRGLGLPVEPRQGLGDVGLRPDGHPRLAPD